MCTFLNLSKQNTTYHCSLIHSNPADSLSYSCSRSCQWCWYTCVHNFHFWYHTHPHLNKSKPQVELEPLHTAVFHVWILTFDWWSESTIGGHTIDHTMVLPFIPLQNEDNCGYPHRRVRRLPTNTYPGTWCSHLGNDHTEVAPVSIQKMSDTLAKRYHPECSPTDPRKLDHFLPVQWLSPHLQHIKQVKLMRHVLENACI